ncbi:hypothetical protein [Virgibacillus halodenitrificans]|uniref:HTH cro/C1-type domain-containing protein n=1 Tax=Virgibacillus halodenitrificans TaxID=1482 RepID=A0ABR7VU81_VIRHA|nr:hypothetical protein [Virgibacillus halodenitrificans]MBD1224029.1 hypothetical protein [Virgibacillus halodenitrificans]
MKIIFDFETFLYKGIGSRIKNYRNKKLGVKQDKLVAKLKTDYYISVDTSRLSAIENGRAHKKKNPHLLTESQLEGFTELFNCEKKELIFGNHIDKEESVKIFLLAIIMNSEKDEEGKYIIPFMDFLFRNKNSPELRKSIKKKSSESKNKIKTLSENKEVYLKTMKGLNKVKEMYPFFTNEKVSEKYQLLLGETHSRIELISNLLIKLLMGDLEFATYYILRMSKVCEIKGSNDVIYSFIENKGMIGGALVGNKKNFYIFANAFEKTWERHKELFMEYFEEHLFNKKIKPVLKYKEINNELFNDVIIDSKLSNLIFSVIEKDRFSIETMDGHNLFYQHMLNRYVDKETGGTIDT